jgi:hypothetical protein
MRTTPVLALPLAALLVGCGGDDKQDATKVPASCAKIAPAHPVDPPDGFPLPESGLVERTEQQGDTFQIHGFVARAPGEALDDLTEKDGVDVIDSEDDGSNAELSFTQNGYRVAYKFVRACPDGSNFTAVRVREPS